MVVPHEVESNSCVLLHIGRWHTGKKSIWMLFMGAVGQNDAIPCGNEGNSMCTNTYKPQIIETSAVGEIFRRSKTFE